MIPLLKNKKIIAALLTVTLIAGGGYMMTNKASASAKQAFMNTATVQEQTVASNVYASGNIIITESRKMKPEGKGFVTKLHVKVGDKVKKDQPLADVDTSDLEKSLQTKNINLAIQQESLAQTLLEGDSSQKSNLKRTLINYNQVKTKYESDKVLFESGSISKSAFNASKDALDKENLNLNSAQEAVENSTYNSKIRTQKLNIQLIETEIEDTKQRIAKRSIVSPFDGVVTEINFKETEMYDESQHLIKVQNMDSREIKSFISEGEINKLSVNQTVKITANSIKGETLEGTILSLSPSTVQKEGKKQAYTEIRVTLNDPSSRLRDGFLVNLTVQTNQSENTKAVSFEAISRDLDGKATVTKLNADGTTLVVPVTIGVEGDVYSEIISDDIQLGDQLIIENNSGGGDSGQEEVGLF